MTSGAVAPPARLTADELRAGLLNFHASLRDIIVTYRMPYDTSVHPNQPSGAYVYRIVAMRGSSFLKVNAHGHDGMDWRDDPILARNIVVSRLYRTEWTNCRTYEQRTLAENEPLPEKFRDDFFIRATGWWPPGSDWAPSRDEGAQLALHEVAGSSEYAVVRSTLENVDGHWCHVLERKGRDALWIDADRGFVIMARDVRARDSGALVEQYTLGAHTEVASDIWLPRWWERVQYDFRAAMAEDRKRIIGRTRATAVSVQVNGVSEEMFAVHSQAGDALINRFTGAWQQTESGGLSLLDAAAGLARRISEVREGRRLTWPGWIGGVPFLSAVVLCETWYRVRALASHKTLYRATTRTGLGSKP